MHGVGLFGEVAVRVGCLLHDQRQGGRLVGFGRQRAAYLFEAQRRGFGVDLCLVQRYAVPLDGVAFALQRAGQGLYGFTAGATEHAGQVSAQLDEVVGLRGQLVHGGAAVFQLGADERAQLVVFVLGQAYGSRGAFRPFQHLLGAALEDGFDGALGLFEVAGHLHSVDAVFDQRRAGGCDSCSTGHLEESAHSRTGALHARHGVLGVCDDTERQDR